MKRRLIESRRQQIQNHNIVVNNLDWTAAYKNKNVKKCIIHLPSLSYPSNVRMGMVDIKIRQARQLGRIMDIYREDVDKVIFVSPLELSTEIVSYWKAICSIRDPKAFEKIQFIKPEAINNFPTHNMSLATILKYSAEALNEIK